MAASLKRKLEAGEPTSIIERVTKVQKSYAANTSVKRDIVAIAIPTDMAGQLDRIAASDKTVFQKRVLSLLCQVPKGQVTTYALMSKHLNSSPRAIGNAMRRNPFAPEVPCHRCVATGGMLGGFKGQWPKDGEGITLDEKRMLLRKEGVKFDGNGRVLGTPFSAFV
ncbi:Methylated-DNA--protein-cysteine methyltransferase [Cytospora mali]|uniref:Methylated-DNA--protein-cysteine methyltransferase n=1 Tax=Cytospora mali TaxID=578113 RepID=A0A194UNH5_CYTMA|nr:Methylated-DNA--protein-cysteine methyltransferase [Valsa mali var. pyri (nom. inval.)]